MAIFYFARCVRKLAPYSNVIHFQIVKFETMSLCKCCLFAGVTQYLETGSGSEEAVSSLVTDSCPEEVVRTTFAGVQCVLTSALRVPRLKSEVNVETPSIYILLFTTPNIYYYSTLLYMYIQRTKNIFKK